MSGIYERMQRMDNEAMKHRAEGFIKGALLASVFWISIAVFIYLVKNVL